MLGLVDLEPHKSINCLQDGPNDLRNCETTHNRLDMTNFWPYEPFDIDRFFDDFSHPRQLQRGTGSHLPRIESDAVKSLKPRYA